MPNSVTPENCDQQLLEIMLTTKTVKRIRRIAAKRGVAVDQLVVEAIKDYLQ